jgi:DNA repair ATPase RecN
LLDKTGQIEEIARMLAGEQVTEAARDHARELITQAVLPV